MPHNFYLRFARNLKIFIKILLCKRSLIDFSFEFLMIKFSSINHSLIDFSVVLSYALWFLSIILINDFIIKTYTSQKKRTTLTNYAKVLIVLIVLILLSTSLFYKDSAHFYIIILFLGIIIVLALKAILQFTQIGNKMPAIFKSFTKYIIVGIILILFSAFFEFFETIEIINNLTLKTQITLITHFFFYAGLSMFIVSFEKLYNLQGIYKDIKK